IDHAKFRKPVVPGDQLKLKVEMIKIRNRFCHLKGAAYVDDEVAVEGEIIASLLDEKEFEGT
ncbi:MAG: 3-hydroxyacyl-[acyl-carrier-protein] dehydratase FabZ, partial [Candidatus Aminicenantaceae bacterium]